LLKSDYFCRLLTKRIYMKTLNKNLVAIILVASVAACGNNQTDRALSGGGIGAGVGAVGGAVLGGNPVTGAVVGGLVGAGVGAATKQKNLNLGSPAWKR
jgi:osmotically inducible lipoprotein OsmB